MTPAPAKMEEDARPVRRHRRCVGCGDIIPPARLRLLPGAERCVACSQETAKTEADVPPDGADPEKLRRSVMNPDRG